MCETINIVDVAYENLCDNRRIAMIVGNINVWYDKSVVENTIKLIPKSCELF